MNKKQELQQSLTEAKAKLEEIEKQIAALPDEKDGKAGEWV